MGPAEGAEAPLRVEVVYCPAPGQVDSVTLALPPGSTVGDAIQASGMRQRHDLPDPVDAGLWGRAKPADTPLRDRDRVELYRPLQVDPKEARRLRYRRQRGGASPRQPVPDRGSEPGPEPGSGSCPGSGAA
jgi:putative ubiquitin-RnfH superfamily antitoxin RatB of RatAB toxin-antitoxin module